MNKKEACKAAARAIARGDDIESGVYFDPIADELVVVHTGWHGTTPRGWKFLGGFGCDWGKVSNARAIGEAMRAQHIETRGRVLGVTTRRHF